MNRPATVYELLDRESKWTRGEKARLADGTACSPLDTKAASWSMLGALDFVYQEPHARCRAYVKLAKFLDSTDKLLGPVSIISFYNSNPDFTFSAIRGILAEAEV